MYIYKYIYIYIYIYKFDKKRCPEMLDCPFSHGWKETDYHYDVYKTR